jgi:hypothetical protein
MSRTYKDVPHKHRKFHYGWRHDEIKVPGERYRYIQLPTTKPKRRKELDTEWHWMTTPSWWTSLMMNKPQRRAGRIWERKVLFEDIEITDPPSVGKKPHIYYW